MTKYKSCPKCQTRNLSYAETCGACGASLSNAAIIETPVQGNRPAEGGGFAVFLNVLGVVWLIGGVLLALSALHGYGEVSLENIASALFALLLGVTLFAGLVGLSIIIGKK